MKAKPQKKNLPVTVYFVRVADYIKIGITLDIRKRLKTLEGQCPLLIECLAMVPGTREMEADLHRRFRPYHHRYEWFRADPELLDYITQLKT